jgi:hypothetical protein
MGKLHTIIQTSEVEIRRREPVNYGVEYYLMYGLDNPDDEEPIWFTREGLVDVAKKILNKLEGSE